MRFETPSSIPPQENPENKSRMFEKIKKYARIAAAFGVLSFVGTEVTLGVKAEMEYKDHVSAMSPERKEAYKAMRAKLVELIGESAVKDMEHRDKEAFFKRQEESKEKTHVTPSVDGFEEIGIDNSVFKEVWNEDNGAYPKKWIDGEVEHISYKNKTRKMSGYGEKLNGSSLAGAFDNSFRSITFYDTAMASLPDTFSKSDIAETFDATFSHEIAHGNDWDTNRNLEIDARSKLLLTVINRLESGHAGKTAMESLTDDKSYPEEIEKSDKHAELVLKAKEYWADMSQNYFQYSEWVKEKFPEDFKMVDDFVKQTDPAFDPVKSQQQREAVFHKLK